MTDRSASPHIYFELEDDMNRRPHSVGARIVPSFHCLGGLKRSTYQETVGWFVWRANC